MTYRNNAFPMYVACRTNHIFTGHLLLFALSTSHAPYENQCSTRREVVLSPIVRLSLVIKERMAEAVYGLPQPRLRKPNSASSRLTRVKSGIIRFLPQTQSRFLSIPAELRNSVYELIFQLQPSQENGHEDRPIVTIRPDRRNDANRTPTVLDLLTTCRQVHYEAETMFYGLNHLRYFTKTPHICDPFIRTLRPRRQRAIEVLTVRLSKRRSSNGRYRT